MGDSDVADLRTRFNILYHATFPEEWLSLKNRINKHLWSENIKCWEVYSTFIIKNERVLLMEYNSSLYTLTNTYQVAIIKLKADLVK